MEYNYTNEFKQKHKVYTAFGYAIPFAPNGLKVESIVLFSLIVGVLIILAIISFVRKVSFLQSIFSSAYLIITFLVGVFVWFIFSLTWDNKSILQYIIGRVGYLNSSRQSVEHGHKTVLMNQSIKYRTERGGLRAIKRYKGRKRYLSR